MNREKLLSPEVGFMSRKHRFLGALLLAALWAATGCQAKAPAADEVSAAGGLSIALDQLSETPQFFDCESGGVAMQIVSRSRLCPA